MFNSLNLFLEKHSLIKLQGPLQNSTLEFPIFGKKIAILHIYLFGSVTREDIIVG